MAACWLIFAPDLSEVFFLPVWYEVAAIFFGEE
jgi:hypothetical protein